MDDLPKGPSGKILRLKLPEMILSMSSTASQSDKKEPSPKKKGYPPLYHNQQ
jgi:hypothetical protein